MKIAIAPITALLLALAGGSPAGAQTTAPSADRGADLFAGYSAIPSDGETFHGWQASLGFPLSSRLGLLLDLSGHRATVPETADVNADMLSLMAGPRLVFGGGGRLRPSLHLLAGIVRSKASVRIFDVDVSESRNDLGGAAGGAVDMRLGGRFAARALADYRVVRGDGETASDPRVSLGVVYNFR